MIIGRIEVTVFCDISRRDSQQPAAAVRTSGTNCAQTGFRAKNLHV
jgi:hypothetical protein